MIVVTLSFHPAAHNPSRKGGFGSWRVAQCEQCFDGIVLRSRPFMEVVPWWGSSPATVDPVEFKALRLEVLKPIARGALVSPIKLAMQFIAARANPLPDIYFGSAACQKS